MDEREEHAVASDLDLVFDDDIGRDGSVRSDLRGRRDARRRVRPRSRRRNLVKKFQDDYVRDQSL